MSIDIHGDRDGGMPESFADDLRIGASVEHQTGMSVAEDSIFNISHQTFYAYLRKYAKRAGLGGLKPHDLRHTAAKLRRNNGASIEDVSALLGHRSIATTATYLARMEGEEDKGWEGVATALGVE